MCDNKLIDKIMIKDKISTYYYNVLMYKSCWKPDGKTKEQQKGRERV